MFEGNNTFSGYSVRSLEETEAFYGDTLGIKIERNDMGIQLKPADGRTIFLYEKETHEPATFTVLNFVVEDINAAIEALNSAGVSMEIYPGMEYKQDESGILRGKAAGMGPDIAWFKDPSGNILSVIEE